MLKLSTLSAFLLLPGLALGQGPAITAVLPAANARSVAPTGPVTTSFSQPLTAGSAAALKVYSAQRGGLRTRGTTPAVVSGNTLSFSPSSYGFVAGETVSGTVTKSAASSTGSLARAKTVQFTVATGGTGRGNFSTVPDLVVEQSLQDLAMGDLDGDGDLDLVTANGDYYFYASVNIRLNDGNGNFGSRQELATPQNDSPRGVALGDIDGDGDLDIVSANYVSGSAGVWKNNGAGSFAPMQRVPTRSGALRVALADLDGDGDLDLLSTNSLSDNVTISFNDGTGAFSGLYQDVSVGGVPQALAVGDLDNDGDLDFVTANSHVYHNSVSIRLNDGAGLFSNAQDLRVGNQPTGVTLGDIDGDGDLDLVAANSASKSLSVALNDGAGFFRSSQSVAAGQGPSSVTLGDLDSDGDLDLVATNFTAA